MPLKLNLKSQFVLNKKFNIAISGYSPQEVDEYLDQILQDYVTYEELVEAQNKNLEDKNSIISRRDSTIERLNIEIDNLKKQIVEMSKTTHFGLHKELKEIKQKLDKQKN